MNTPDHPTDATRLNRRALLIATVASMEQIIGAILSTVVGIMLPMIALAGTYHLSSLEQGLIGAAGLIGIGVGSPIIGKLSDSNGYLAWFRICPVLIVVGAVMIWLGHDIWTFVAGLVISGIGVGGGYSLDSTYISELMPPKWSLFMVGVAKASCALGFLGAAVAAWFMLRADSDPARWNLLALIIGVPGLLTLLMRLKWYDTPQWLADHGKDAKALKAARFFFGPNATAPKAKTVSQTSGAPATWLDMLRGKNLIKAIFAGIPWACEGLGVYGFGVFLPVLVMALGIESGTLHGMAKILNSVEVTAIVNFFIVPGFIIGLIVMRKMNHVKMLTWGFIWSAIGLGLLLVAYLLHMPAWVMVAGFVIFEIALNAGPHLITFVIPSNIYNVVDRGAGSGLAAMNGKIGAIAGVIVMPVLLDKGGMTLVLGVSIAVMLLGAFVGLVFGRKLGLIKTPSHKKC